MGLGAAVIAFGCSFLLGDLWSDGYWSRLALFVGGFAAGILVGIANQ